MLIDHKATHVYFVGDFQFMPGMNSVKKSEWEKIKGHPHVKHLLTEEKMKVVSEKDATEEGEHSLAEFDVTKGKKIIEGTFDLELLNHWDLDEKRKPLKAAIQAQVKKIMGVAFKSEESEAKHFKN